MSLNFDPNSSPLGPTQGPQGPGYVPPTTGEGDQDSHDPLASTLSPSLAEALMVQYLLGWPVLPEPNFDQYNAPPTAEGITAMVGAEFGRIGSEMWDKYIDHLAEEKQRIADYLNSPAYRIFVEEHTLKGQVQTDINTNNEESTLQGQIQTELNTNVETKSPVLNAAQFEEAFNHRVLDSVALWGNTIDAVSNFVQENRDSNPEACIFIAASFAITSTFIGDYLNIVDVASTNMVTVNPIQDAVSSILPLVPQQLQEQFTMVINLFAVGLINFSNAEAILKGGQDRPPMTWESAATFAHNILDKVEGNMINGFLMAMLINKTETLGSTQEQREVQLSKLVVLAKALMLAAAVGALLKAATPDLRLNSLIFKATMEEPLVAQSEDDQRLINELSPLVSYFNGMRDEGLISEEGWQSLMDSLGDFFDKNPDFEDFFSPTLIWGKMVENIFNSDIEG